MSEDLKVQTYLHFEILRQLEIIPLSNQIKVHAHLIIFIIFQMIQTFCHVLISQSAILFCAFILSDISNNTIVISVALV